jgi:hypothetical protein
MNPKNVTRGMFTLLIAVEASGWTGILPWSPTYSWLGLIITALAVWAFVEWFDLPGNIWPLFFVGLCMDAAADTFWLYSTIENWDRLMHLIGGALLGLASWHTLKPIFAGTVNGRWRIFLVLALVALFGTLYEGSEMGVDAFYAKVEGKSRGALGDGIDTVEDQLLNLAGGLIVAGIAEYRRRR